MRATWSPVRGSGHWLGVRGWLHRLGCHRCKVAWEPGNAQIVENTGDGGLHRACLGCLLSVCQRHTVTTYNVYLDDTLRWVILVLYNARCNLLTG